MKKKDLAELLNISRPTLDKILVSYSRELKEYIITDSKGRFIDFEDEGVQKLMDLAKNEPKTISQTKENQKNELYIIELETTLKSLKNELDAKNETMNAIKELNEHLKAENIELKEYKDQQESRFFVRLLGYKPKKK